MYMLMFFLFKKKKSVFTMHSIIPVITKERLKKIFFNVTNRNRKNREKMSNVWVVRLTYLCFMSDRNCLLSFHECYCSCNSL